MKRWVSPVLLLILLLALLGLRYCQSRSDTVLPSAAPTSTRPVPGKTGSLPAGQVPGHALEVLQFVRQHGEAPEGYVGGREFQNREKRLPIKDAQGHTLRYSEWDVHPKKSGQNRGAERLVTGSDHSAWYTGDHYKTFQKIE